MPQDAFTLKFLCDELNTLFKGGKINKIVQPESDCVVLTVYNGKKTLKMILDVNPANPRIGVSEEKTESPVTAPNFCMLLRKHLLSATIEQVSLVGFDRIVKIDVSPSTEFFDSKNKAIYVELMGRYSNVILTEDGKVLGANRGINFFDNGVRPLIVGYEYKLPPVHQKFSPYDSGLVDVLKPNESLDGQILEYVQGVAQSTSKEIAFRFGQTSEDGKRSYGERAFDFINDFVNKTELAPCVLIREGKVLDVFTFPYQTIEGQYLNFDKLYLAEEYYFTEKISQKKFINLKERLTSVTNTAIKKIKKKKTSVNAKIKESNQAEENRVKGELIICNLYRIEKGAKSVVLDNYYEQSKTIVELDENLSPQKNAEKYFKKYNKQKKALTILLPQKEQLEKEQSYFESVLEEIELSSCIEELICVKQELVETGVIKEQSKTARKSTNVKPYREYLIDGFIVKFGKNNVENDKLTLSAKPSDIWVHSKDYHSSHGIIETKGKSVPKETIVKVAGICGYYSKARLGGKTEIVYTEKKNVKKPSKAKAGFFTYTEYKTVVITPFDGKEYLNIEQN